MAQRDYQGGKRFGQLRNRQADSLETTIDNFLRQGDYDVTRETLEAYKKQFMEYDLDDSGDIDLMELKQMMEKLGQAKTHLELKKMIAQVDLDGSGTINFYEFLTMMLGPGSSILQKILAFEALNKPKEKPVGIAPKRSLADLP